MKRLLSVCFLLCCFQPSFGQKKEGKGYGSRIVSVNAVANIAGLGGGFQFEKVLRKRMSVVLPVEVCITKVPPVVDFHHPNTGLGRNRYPAMFLFAPGFRYYPTGTKGVVRYCVGLDLTLGVGKGLSNHYTNNTNDLGPREIIGIQLANCLVVQPTPHIRVSLAVQLGVGGDNIYSEGLVLSPVGQLLAGIGYRFR